MATANQKIRYDIEAAVSGEQDVNALARQLEGLAGTLEGELKTQAQASVKALRQLGAEQDAIDKFVALKNEAGAAAARLAEAQQAAQKLASEMAASTEPTRAQAGQLEKLRDAVRSAKNEVQDNATALDKSRKVLGDYEIGTNNLAQAQVEVKAAISASRAQVEGIASSYAAAGKSLEGIVQVFQGDLKKLGLEGAQVPAGLEQSFRKLGIDGVGKTEAAVRELQVALAQIRNSPDVLAADKKAAVAAFNREVERLKSEAEPAAKATRDLANAGASVGNSLGGAATKVAAWAGALVGLNELKSLAGQVLETGSAFENLEVRLSNLLGGTDAAASAMGMIKELAATTPFEVTALAESFVKLTAFGMEPTTEQMRSLADVAANLGGGTEVLTGVTLALGQAWVKGKLQGEEIMQLAERGVPVWDALAAATGRTVPELQKMSEAGQLGRGAISGLIDELGRMNAGASDQLMRTYAGAVSNAKDALAEFFDMIARSGVLDFLTEKIRDLLAEFERMKQTGELQKTAQDIADGFITAANAAEAVTRTLVDMAPVIEAAVGVWVAFKAVNIANALYSIAAGTAVAAPGLVATAAGATSAATGMTVAAGAATALSVAIKRLLAATGLGLMLVAIGEIGVRLLGVGEEAKKAGDDIEDGLGRAEAASQRAADAAKAAAHAQRQHAKEARAAADERAKAAAAAAAAEVGSIEAASIARKTDAAVALQDLETRRLLASQTEEQARLVGDETGAVQARVKVMEIDIAISEARIAVARVEAENAIAVAEAKLTEARATGVLTQAKEAELQGAIRIAQAKLREADAQGEGVKLLQKGLEKTQEAIRSGATYKDVVDRAASANKRLGAAAEEAGNKMAGAGEKAKGHAELVTQAFKDAGIKTQAELNKAAEETEKRFELIRDSGQASADGVKQAWRQMAEAQIAANGGVASETLKAEAAMHGLRIEVDETGRAIVKNMDDAKQAVDGFAKGVQQAQDQLKRLKEVQGLAGAGGDLSGISTEELQKAQADLLKEGGALSSTEYIKLRNELMGRKKPTTDADGFTLDKSGNRLVMGGDLTTLTGIKNFLQQAGLEEDQAKKVALEFSDGKGNIPYFSNPGQIKYGGAASTISEALLKAAERTTFGSGSAVGAGVGRTVNMNLTIGGQTRTVQTNEEGAQALTQTLQAARLAAGG